MMLMIVTNMQTVVAGVADRLGGDGFCSGCS